MTQYSSLEDILKHAAEFEPCAYYDEALGMLRVHLKDCRTVTESVTTGLDILWEVNDQGEKTDLVVGVAIYAPRLKMTTYYKEQS